MPQITQRKNKGRINKYEYVRYFPDSVYQKNCSVCDETFFARRINALYCSPKCSKKGQRLSKAFKKINEGNLKLKNLINQLGL